MYTRIINAWDDARSSFWFAPALMMVVAVVAAIGLVQFDATVGLSLLDSYSILNLSPPAARSILSAIVGAIVTSTGVVFSMTIVTLSLASSQFGSRLIRTYRNRRSTHFSLGIFVATSLYCILVLTCIRETENYSFVPITAVGVGIVLTIVCLTTLVFYIHDISNAIQAPNVIQSSALDLDKAIDRIFPSQIGEPIDEASDKTAHQPTELGKPELAIDSDRVGYVHSVENDTILTLAQKHEIVIGLQVKPGDFVYETCQIAEVFSPGSTLSELDEEALEDLRQDVRACLIVGFNRTPKQDVRYAFNELVEIAVRALSPGINDPYTAITCIDRIQAALVQVKQRKTPSAYRMDEESNALRVIVSPVTLEDCIDESLGMIEGYVDGNPKVKARLKQAFVDLGLASDALDVSPNSA